MAATNGTLREFYASWQLYQDHLAEALAPLTAEQLALRAAPGLRTIDEIARHNIVGRTWWFMEFLGEQNEEMRSLNAWEDSDAPPRTADELVRGMRASWAFMAECLARWTPGDMDQTFPHTWRDQHHDLSRSWVVWHVLEHDLHHGGEISLILGMHGLRAPDI